MARQHAQRSVLLERGCHRGLPPTRESRGMVAVPMGSKREHLPLQCAVRHLRLTGPTRFTPRRRSVCLGLFLAAVHHNRLLGVIYNPSCPLLRQTISSRSEGRLKPSANREDIMDDTIITTYYLCEEFLKSIGHRDDPQVRLSTAEVMTIP